MISSLKLQVMAALVGLSSAVTTDGNFTVAMVRSAPPNWPMPLMNMDWTGVTLNIGQTVDYGIELIQKAAAEGADLITFPELWFPGFPKGNAMNNWTVDYLPSYIENSLTIGDANWNRIVDAIAHAQIYGGLAYSERLGDHIYMTQTLLAPNGSIINHRHKLRPSGSERWFFTDGNISEIKVVATPHGRIGQLECGEHMYHTTRYLMGAQVEHLHLGPFPYLQDEGEESLWWENVLVEAANGRAYAGMSGAYNFMAAIGAARAFDPLGSTIASIDAAVNMTETPLLYASANTTSFNLTETYRINGQTSWGILKEIYDGFPEYIPREEGNVVGYREKSVEWLMTGALTTEVGESFDQ
ncbi:hypothetical protein CkaCkLH20_05504 [Colletotrichum karsti]|uniref:CN hydrolase domain-containing protein n=1 Tax=Colletotrichum karsti TaxID=1095194 RepID=A0A9P6I4M0_9PEZI|nr:uncharacterized protein CkaCkLH20_05504 [Colletotrichum karsti]KAF9877238.1 hypothetical protein CkaCkLH20_05504 [Colletotrichum karsti]